MDVTQVLEAKQPQPTAEWFEEQLTPLLALAFGMALHLTRNRDDAEDLLQEAVIKAFCSLHTFERGTNFKAWLLRILTNLCCNWYRKRQREPEVVAFEDVTDR